MSIKHVTLTAVLCAATGFATHHVTSQDGAGFPEGMTPEMMEEMMANVAKGMPGPHHKEMARGVGEWEIDSKHWMAPGVGPSEAPAHATIETILGGRFLHEHFKMDFMGETFEGHLFLGYDNIQEQWQAVWMDSMTSGMMISTGEAQADGTQEMRGTMRDVRTPDGRPFRLWSKHNDDGTMTFRMYDTSPEGEEWMVMENTYHSHSR